MKPTPLTDKFLEDLRLKMQELKIKKTKLANYLEMPKQSINRYFHTAKSRKPTGEVILKIQEWIKKGFNIF